MLGPALELAVAVARADALDDPPVQPPRSLRPILTFSRLPSSARQVVRRALDQDDGFRARVAAASGGEASLGRASWLYLARPDGWESELEQLRAAAAEASSAGAEAREERSAQRRLRGAQEAAQRAEEQLAQARAEAASANAALTTERQGRRQAETERDALQRRVASLERERDAAHRRAAAATNELQRLAQELRERQAAPPLPDPEPAPTPLPPASAASSAADHSRPAQPSVPLDQIRSAVQEAAAAAARLGAALGAAAAARGQDAAQEEPPEEPPPGPGPGPGREPRRRARPSRPVEERLPLVLPPGLLEGSREAAEFLVRSPGMLVLVDGYNATLRLWPEHPIAEQRQRLVQALAGLSARNGCDVHVVFDGTGDLARSPSLPRGRVRMTFSPAGVEADEVILDLLDQAPAHRPVAVATDDRRVRREAAARGANSLSQKQLFAVSALDS
ncbi:MAG: NYN domain-containing protein [Actinobacteria bacterium]|nr:NYN domain-containing protein [Actinomycetota bacterium]